MAVMSKATSPIQSRGVLPSVNAACLLLVGIEAAAAAHVRKNIRLEEWDSSSEQGHEGAGIGAQCAVRSVHCAMCSRRKQHALSTCRKWRPVRLCLPEAIGGQPAPASERNACRSQAAATANAARVGSGATARARV